MEERIGTPNKTVFCTIWLSSGEPQTYAHMIKSFSNNTDGVVYVFTDSTLAPSEEALDSQKELIKQYSDRLKFIDIQTIKNIKENTYYQWITTVPVKKFFPEASDCLRFLIVDYLLNLNDEFNSVFFFEADVELKEKIDFSNPQMMNDKLNTNLDFSNQIISFSELPNYSSLYCPKNEAVKKAIHHVCKTYDNIGKYVLHKEIELPFGTWFGKYDKFAVENEERYGLFSAFIRSLLYKEQWQEPKPEVLEEMIRFSIEDRKNREEDFHVSQAELRNLYGIELPDQIDAFIELLVRAKNSFIVHHEANSFSLKHNKSNENSAHNVPQSFFTMLKLIPESATTSKGCQS